MLSVSCHIYLHSLLGDSSQDYGDGNVEVDGIVDETHLTQHMSANPPIDQVVEVLVQPQGGQGDATISLTTSDVSSVGQGGYISANRVGGVVETSEVFQSKDSSVVTASASSLQQQQQVMNAQNVIPIGNANLSGLANILQNPEVLAAINAAAASNKFIVIGPVGMLSGANTATTNNVSLAGTYSSGTHLASTSVDSVVSETANNPPSSIVTNNDTVIQMQGPLDSGIASHCNVEMIAADTSQDAPTIVDEHSTETSENEVQSSAPNVIEQLVQSSAAIGSRDSERQEFTITSEEAHVESSQDTDVRNVASPNQNVDTEVSSSASSKQAAKATVEDGVVGDVQSTNVIAMQGSHMDNAISSGNVAGSEADVYYTVQQSDDDLNSQPGNQLIVTMKDQLVSSSSCTTSIASESFMTSNAMTGNGQSMVMVTADGKSYITTVAVPDGLNPSEGQQILLASASANSLSMEGNVASTVNLASNEASCVLLTTQVREHPNSSDVAPVQSSDINVPHQVELSDFTVTDSTTRVCVNSSNVTDSATNFIVPPESGSSLEVSGSINPQPDSMQSKVLSTMTSDSTVDSQADSIIESSQVFMLASAVDENHSTYPNTAADNGYHGQQSANVDASSLIVANSSGESVVSGTENFISSDLQRTGETELQKTGVTSSRDLSESKAESTTPHGSLQQDNNSSDHEDSQVSTSLQI